MNEIIGKTRSVRELLNGTKYSIDYYQREYKWQEKQIQELIEDLCGRFLQDFRPDHERNQVAEYGQYFLGSIILSQKDVKGIKNFIVDGQQRLTSLTLLLTYLRNAQKTSPKKVKIDELIFSEDMGSESFNLDPEDHDRYLCMEALYESGDYDADGKPETIQNLVARYHDIESYFPLEIDDEVRPYFLDWLQRNVQLVEIAASSDENAYTIFETMNDRGLSLTPTDMLKGFLLANIADDNQRGAANTLWKDRVLELVDVDKEADSDFFKAWLRSQYAETIRERKKNAQPKDFDLIGTQFHRWVRDHRATIGLNNSNEFAGFITSEFDFYSKQYLEIQDTARTLYPDWEAVRYVADTGFTLYPMLMLAPLRRGDNADTVALKIQLVGKYLDILLARRLWNFRSIAYSTLQYAMFLTMRDIRGLAPKALAKRLYDELNKKDVEVFGSSEELYLNQQNRKSIHYLLARLTDAVETGAGQPSQYCEFMRTTGKNRFEVEHIWADKFDRHKAEFSHASDFDRQRNRIGGLLLVPKSFNASYGASTYAKKQPEYLKQNLLARSLHSDCYSHHPGFQKWRKGSGLDFKAHPQFLTADMEERGLLYLRLAEYIWNPQQLLDMV